MMIRARQSPESIAAFATVGMGILVLYFFFPYAAALFTETIRISIFHKAWFSWMNLEEWGHGVMVGPISLAIVYLKRKELAAIPIQGSAWGLLLLGLGLLFYFAGFIADVDYAGYFAFNFTLAGLILWFLGVRWMKALIFPWFFLFFMWPMPYLDNVIAFPLRMLMSQSSHIILNLIGVANVRSGTAVLSAADPARHLAEGARFAIDVADPCSGIHSLFALVMVSALYGYFAVDTTWKKVAIFFLAIPLAIVGNMGRLILLTFGTILWGSAFAVGTLDHPTWFHMGAGYFVFAIAIGGMIGAGALLQRLPASLLSKSGRPSSPAAASSTVKPSPRSESY
jgi:exosortase